jgi:hypothetical protein
MLTFLRCVQLAGEAAGGRGAEGVGVSSRGAPGGGSKGGVTTGGSADQQGERAGEEGGQVKDVTIARFL